MKHISKIFSLAVISIFAAFAAAGLSAQEVPEGYVLVDSVVYRPAVAVDTLLSGRDVFASMPSKSSGAMADADVYQTGTVRDAMKAHIRSNASRPVSGYRVRIFFDNKQSARVESEAALKRFETIYHGVSAYRTYVNPYFKVTVGDFRTRSEAMALLSRIKGTFPSAFVVKENIGYPVVDKSNAYIVDTVKVLRPVGQGL